jgi:hypothetical protein
MIPTHFCLVLIVIPFLASPCPCPATRDLPRHRERRQSHQSSPTTDLPGHRPDASCIIPRYPWHCQDRGQGASAAKEAGKQYRSNLINLEGNKFYFSGRIFSLAREGPMGNGPWVPKNLYTRVRVLLGLPPGRDPFDQHARLGLRPSSSMGSGGSASDMLFPISRSLHRIRSG